MNPLARSALRAAIRHTPTIPPEQAVRRLDRELTHTPVTTLARSRLGARFPVTTSDIIQRYLYMFGTWEPHLTAWISQRLNPGDTFIDVGANIGYYTMLASHLVGRAGRVVAIEPVPRFHRQLQAATRLNGARNVRTVNRAVAAGPGRVEMYLGGPGNLGGTSMVRPRTADEFFCVTTDALPDILTSAELQNVRLIKIDVEGAEEAALRGLTPALSRLHPDVELIIEVTPRTLAKQGTSVQGVIDPLREAGFHMYRIANDYDPASYPTALRWPSLPQRWERPVTEMSDLVASRIDAAHL
ncbi:FkbM family methyltransferase [Nocardiopsis sp. YSL2]|uniref:FkbM family methyltransferase n=1 Tax=Nocardiopsis sp. YSL2 TaxID=2939492 RepID=UPI0026F43B60|nr:FkbM family methyltransferase [Nocardiopsis sp. YSL2]